MGLCWQVSYKAVQRGKKREKKSEELSVECDASMNDAENSMTVPADTEMWRSASLECYWEVLL